MWPGKRKNITFYQLNRRPIIVSRADQSLRLAAQVHVCADMSLPEYEADMSGSSAL